MASDLCYLSATEAIALFKSKQLSPVELLHALIERAGEIEPTINAFSFEYFDEALLAARAAEQAYHNGEPRTLEGIPVAIKDEAYIAGKPTTNGSLLLKEYVADYTSATVQRLLDAGAIVHARTATPEFSLHFCTFSRLWGITRNPWNPEYSVGGSSGGSGAALAAGTATLASGSDLAGSVRVPASQNGVIGYKPPYGRVPQDPPWNFDTYCHEGPLARTVADCIAYQNVIAGPHPADITTLRPKLELPTEFENIKDMRIAYSFDFGFAEVAADIRRNTAAALATLEQLGARVEEVDLGWSERCARTALAHYQFYGGAMIRRDFGDPAQHEYLTDYIRSFIAHSYEASLDDVLDGLDYTNFMYDRLAEIFTRYDALICPTMAIASVKADFDYSKDKLLIDGTQVDPMLGMVLTYPFNILSRCPVLSVPAGQDSNGVPTGIQIVAPTYDDVTAFRVAAAYESAVGPFFEAGTRPAI